MNLIKIGGATLNQTPLDWEGNKNRILDAINLAKAEGVSILCLPELCISGYGCEDAFYSQGVHQSSQEVLLEILPHTKEIATCVGLPIMFQNRIFNTVCFIADGEIIGFVAKQYLAGDGIHYEPRWFTPWEEDTRGEVNIDGKKYPIGDIFFQLGEIKVGFEICEDAWVSKRPGSKLHRYGVDIILNPSASHFAFDKLKIRKRFVLEGSRAFGCSYIYSNLSGNEAGRAIYDGGTLIASSGQLQAIGHRLTFSDVKVTTAVVDIDTNRLNQAQSNVQFQFADLQGICIEKDFESPQAKPEAYSNEDLPWESSPFIKEEEFARALAIGLFDYMRKSFSKGFVVSLSGGADSSTVVTCCYLMIKLGVEQLGIEQFKKRLSYFSEIQDCKSVLEMANKIITTAYQPTENSGEITQNAAQSLANAVNTQHFEFDVNPIFRTYTKTISESLGRELNWEEDDLALQNIQARVRAPSVWMMANIKNGLLLSTSNRSEAAVGYATMDGDTSGGLSPIAGIDKAFVRSWLVWMEKNGVDGKIKLPELVAVNEQQPTAELRPQDSKQTDEADLMPYDLLDDIEEAAIRDKKMPLDCYLLLKVNYPQYSNTQLKAWTTKFFKLWSRNQWKRERYAPSFHLDDKNLDPKTWCRFPILSGGFQRELKILSRYED